MNNTANNKPIHSIDTAREGLVGPAGSLWINILVGLAAAWYIAGYFTHLPYRVEPIIGPMLLFLINAFFYRRKGKITFSERELQIITPEVKRSIPYDAPGDWSVHNKRGKLCEMSLRKHDINLTLVLEDCTLKELREVLTQKVLLEK